jgi:hypothetical protein
LNVEKKEAEVDSTDEEYDEDDVGEAEKALLNNASTPLKSRIFKINYSNQFHIKISSG